MWKEMSYNKYPDLTPRQRILVEANSGGKDKDIDDIEEQEEDD
jgi:hypothetical protein